MIKLLSKLEEDGNLKEMFKKGIISTKVKFYYDIYLEFDKLKRIKKLNTQDAVTQTADTFKVSESTIYRSIRMIQG